MGFPVESFMGFSSRKSSDKGNERPFTESNGNVEYVVRDITEILPNTALNVNCCASVCAAGPEADRLKQILPY